MSTQLTCLASTWAKGMQGLNAHLHVMKKRVVLVSLRGVWFFSHSPGYYIDATSSIGKYQWCDRAASCLLRAAWVARQGRYDFEQRAARSAALEDSAASQTRSAGHAQKERALAAAAAPSSAEVLQPGSPM